jgi:DNA-binding transcriptional regulator YdaS (Cro superfamily)
MRTNEAIKKVVKKVGSMAELGRLLGASTGNVSDWVAGRRAIPARFVRKLVTISEGEVTEQDLRPDVFYDDEKKDLRLMVA